MNRSDPPAKTYWNGEPCKARRCLVVVGPSPRPTWWCADLEGTTVEAVEVTYGDSPPFYIDNGDGSGWLKVTVGLGSPQRPHRSVPCARVVDAGPGIDTTKRAHV